MGSRKGMSGATWFTENAAENMKHSSPMMKQPSMGWDTDQANRGTAQGAEAAALRSKISAANTEKSTSMMSGAPMQKVSMGWDTDAANRGTAAGAEAAANRSITSAKNTEEALSTTPSRGSAESIMKNTEAGGPGDTTETSAVGSNTKSTRMGKAEREGNRILNDDSLSTDQKQSQALEQRKKYDKAQAKNIKNDARDEERGAIREDRKTKKIDKIAKRNNISVEDATSQYDSRRNSVNSFTSKGSGGKRGNSPYSDSSRKNNQDNVDAAEETGVDALQARLGTTEKKDYSSFGAGTWQDMDTNVG